MQELAPYMTIGSQLTFTVLVMAAIGWWLDNRWSTAPLMTGICAGVGAVVGLVTMIRYLTNLSKSRMQNQSDKPSATPTEK